MQPEIWLIIVLILLSALFSASETALTAISRIKVRKLLDQKHPSAKVIHFLKDHPAQMLATVLVCNNVVNTWASILVGALIEGYFDRMGMHREGLAIGVAVGAMTFILLVFGEITPKTLAIRHAERMALWLGPMLGVLEFILRPLVYILVGISRPMIYVLSGNAPEKGPILTEEEIRTVLSVGEKEGIIGSGERAMISSIFEFGDTMAKEVMTPRPDMQVIDFNAGPQEVIKSMIQLGHSRIPVFEGNVDNITGVLYAKDLLGVVIEEIDLKQKMRTAVFIPETKKIDAVLRQMQAANTHIVIVVDEYGSVSGLLTMEDIIEEIVGEIQDEFERRKKEIDRLEDKTYRIDGKVLVSDLNQSLGIHLPESTEYDTIAGFVVSRLEKVPSAGDSVKHDNLLVTVERVHHRRISSVKLMVDPNLETSEMVGG